MEKWWNAGSPSQTGIFAPKDYCIYATLFRGTYPTWSDIILICLSSTIDIPKYWGSWTVTARTGKVGLPGLLACSRMLQLDSWVCTFIVLQHLATWLPLSDQPQSSNGSSSRQKLTAYPCLLDRLLRHNPGFRTSMEGSTWTYGHTWWLNYL